MIHLQRRQAEELLLQQYYRPHELADLLGIGVDFVNHEVAARRLRARRLGQSTIDISREAVLEWLSHREEPADNPWHLI